MSGEAWQQPMLPIVVEDEAAPRPRHLDLFSGVGGFSVAFDKAGFETVAFSEIEPFPCNVLAERFPGVPNLGDITQTTPEQIHALGHIDVVTFGSPCQDFSVAGKRLGLEGHRSSLFHEAIRVVRLCQPRLALFENVPGLFSSAGGWDFAAVLDEMAESGALDIAWSVLDAQWFGVPQRRRRIFVVADFRGESAGEILSISEGVCRDTAPSREEGKAVAALSANGVGTCGADDNQGQGGGLLASAITASAGHHGYSSPRGDGTVIQEPVAFAENQRGEVRTSDTHPQLTAGGGKPGQGYPAVAVDLQNNALSRDGNTGTLDTTTPRRGGGQALMIGMAVRRLTPLECERLQGFPDGWTAIPKATDSARYRAMGNAVAVPVVEWMAKRMARSLQV